MKTFLKYAGAVLAIMIAVYVIGNITHKDDYFVNQKFIIVNNNEYSYLIRHIPARDTLVFIDSLNSMRHTIILTRKEDTLFTVLDQQSYLYNHYKEQDQFFNSYKEGDTIVIKSIKKNKFWTKLSSRK